MPRPREQSEPALGLDSVLEIWQRRKWLAIVVFSAALAGAVSLTRALPDLYRATATVLVERQQVSEALVRPSVTAELETRIQTIDKEVRSRARLTDVIARLDLYPELRGRVPIDAIVERMRREIDLSLSGVEQTSGRTATIAFSLSYTGRDPVTVAQVANTLVGFYVEENTKSRERQAVKTADFLRAQLAEIKQTMDAQQQRAGEFKLRHNGELPQQIEVNLSALDRLNTQLRLNGEYQIRAMERRERLEHELAVPDRTGPASDQSEDPGVVELRKLRQQLVDLRRKFSDRYPDVIRVAAEIAVLEQGMPAPTTGQPTVAAVDAGARVTARALAEVDRQIASLKTEEGSLRQAIGAFETRVENAPQRQDELQQLTLDSEASKERYEMLLKRYEEARLAESLEQGQNVEQFRILDAAVPSARPAAPNRLYLLAMGLFGALGLALGAVVGAEKLDTTFHSVDDLRAYVSIPALAVIRRIPTRSEARGRRLRVALVTVSVIVGLALIVIGAHHVGSGNEQIVALTVRGRG